MPKYYPFAISAKKRVETSYYGGLEIKIVSGTNVTALKASNKHEAYGKAMSICKQHFPKAKGYSDWKVSGGLLYIEGVLVNEEEG